MVLSDTSVRRPVLATVMSLIIIVFGAMAFFKLPLRELPDVDQPVVGVNVSYSGASAQVIETQITRPIENQLSGIEGIDFISSSSRDGRGSVNITFKLERNLEDAANDVRNAVSRARGSIPVDATEPVVSKADADAQPIIWYSITSDKMSKMELSDYVQRLIADRISTLDGVASVRVGGQLTPSMKIWIDPAALAARNLTSDDIENALRRQNIETPAGYVEGVQRDYNLRVERNFATPEDFMRIAINRNPNDPSVRLGDVARVELAPEDVRRVYHANGSDAVGIGIVRQSKANSLDVARLVKAEVEAIKKTIPPGMEIALNADNTVFIDQAIKEVYKTLGEACILVVLVIFLFLGSARAAAIPAAVIPVCMIGIFSVLALLGFSINLLTLLALVLSIGIVVDDSIVVLENIQRRVDDEGEPPKVAALRGAGEVAFAVISTSAVMVAVFTPLLFVGGYVGKLFTELAATVAGVVIISAFCSLSLTPMMCSKILRPVKEATGLIKHVESVLDAIRASYRSSLGAALNNKIGVYAVYGAVVLIGAYLFVRLPSELVPKEDRGIINVNMQADEGTNFTTAAALMDQAERIVLEYVDSGEIAREITITPGFGGSTNFTGGQIQIFLKPWNERKRSSIELIGELESRFAQITGANFRVNSPDAIGGGAGGGGGGVSIALGGPEYAPLAQLADRIVERLRTNPNLLRPRSNFNPNSPRALVEIDRERAAALGVSSQAIGRALEATMGSRRVNTFARAGEEYSIYIQAERSERSELADLTDKYVRSDTNGQLIPLSSVVTVKTLGDQSERPRLNRMAQVQIGANLPPGVSIGQGIAEVERVVREEIGSQPVVINYTGAAKTFKDASGAILFAFLFALLIVFLVLSAQFESFVHPLVIMVTVPLAVTGGLFGLYAFGSSLNIYSQIGIIILIALAAKNGILIVEFANQLRDKGQSIREAIANSADLRLRPILMTSAATAIGAVPLIFGDGAGAESRRTIGVVIVFGVIMATVLTLFVVPVFYELLAKYTRSPEQTRREIEGYEAAEPEGAHAHPAE